MSGHDDGRVYDVVAFDELEYDEAEQLYTFECPCGDLFEISQAELDAGERIARCPSCSLRLKVVMPGEEGDDEDRMNAAEQERAAAEAVEEAEFAELDRKLAKELPVSQLQVHDAAAADQQASSGTAVASPA